jgi:nucleotide-binding universal stress UspA family protein
LILLCYDGSPDARTAIDRAGELFGSRPATVLTVWEPFVDMMARTGADLAWGTANVHADEIDAAAEQSARVRAGEGVEQAGLAGFAAEPRTAALHTTVAEAILAEAEAVDARAIVLGTRGLAGLKSMLLGSVSHAVLQHADRPVVVVPSPEAAAARRASRS